MQRVRNAADHVEAHDDGELEHDEVRGHGRRREHNDNRAKQHCGNFPPPLGECRFLLGLLDRHRLSRGLLFLGGGRDADRGRRPHARAVECDGDATNDLVILVEDEHTVLVRRRELEEIHDILTIQLRSLPWQTPRQVGVADDGHTIIGDDDFTWFGQRAVAAQRACAHVDNNATGLHAGDGFLGEQQRGGASRHLCGRDDDVVLARLFLVDPEDACLLVLVEGLGVSIRTFLLDGNLDEGRTERLDLVGHFGTYVGGRYFGAHGARRADGCKTRDTNADDIDAGRGHLARGRHLAGEQASEDVGGLDDSAIAAHVGHGRAHVEGLRAR